MSDFKPRSKKLSLKTIPASDQGVTVEEALVLIEDSEYKQQILEALAISEIAGDKIAIPGATSLLQSVLETDNHFAKFDLNRRYENLAFTRPDSNSEYHEKDVEIQFNAELEGKGMLTAAPSYAAQPDLLEKTGMMRRYAKTLIDNERIDMVFHDLEEVRSIYNADNGDHEFSYRIIKNLGNGAHYYRALTSTDRYRDYNIKLSVFVFLIAIHRLMKATGDAYILNRAEHTESRIKAFFEKTGKLQQTPLGKVKFLIELRNNEIKQGSVKFSGICAIVYEGKDKDAEVSNANPVIAKFDEYVDEYEDSENSNSSQEDIYLTPRPNKLKYLITSIKHNVNPGKALPKMIVADKVKEVEEQLYADIQMADDAKTVDEIRTIIKSKVKALQADSFLGPYKAQFQRIIPENLTNMHELLRLVNKLNLIVPEKNVDAKEYLRHMFFEAIVERGRPGFSKTDKEEDAD